MQTVQPLSDWEIIVLISTIRKELAAYSQQIAELEEQLAKRLNLPTTLHLDPPPKVPSPSHHPQNLPLPPQPPIRAKSYGSIVHPPVSKLFFKIAINVSNVPSVK